MTGGREEGRKGRKEGARERGRNGWVSFVRRVGWRMKAEFRRLAGREQRTEELGGRQIWWCEEGKDRQFGLL